MDTSGARAEAARLFSEVEKTLKHSMRKTFEDVGLTMPQCLVIGTLIKSGEMKISELSNKVNLSNSTVSGIVDRLENQGLVVRTRSEEDRRTVYVKATQKVEEIYKGIHKKVEKSLEKLLSSGTDEEIEKIIEGLNTLNRILNDNKKQIFK
ncbi:MAG: MarR family transcriptional regulator [Clostridiaceae bacterium]